MNSLQFFSSVLLLSAAVSPLTHGQEPELMSEEEFSQLLDKTFEKSDYVMLARIRQCKDLGSNSPPDAVEKHWFYRLTIAPGENLLGDFRARSKKAMENAGLEFPEDWTFETLHTLEKDAFAPDPDQDYVIVLEHMKASSMQGVIPVRITQVMRLSPEQLAMAKTQAKEYIKAQRNENGN